MERVPRSRFVPRFCRSLARLDRALPIGMGQTVSQPSLVARMIELAAVGPDSRVLEIGTGSGYQAALLAELVDRVYTVEILPRLADRARSLLQRLGYRNVHVRVGDGYEGWSEHAPFDAILVTACCPAIPPPLIDQLRVGGHMILPIGPMSLIQDLTLVTRDAEGHIHREHIAPVAFVPLTGEHGSPEN